MDAAIPPYVDPIAPTRARNAFFRFAGASPPRPLSFPTGVVFLPIRPTASESHPAFLSHAHPRFAAPTNDAHRSRHAGSALRASQDIAPVLPAYRILDERRQLSSVNPRPTRPLTPHAQRLFPKHGTTAFPFDSSPVCYAPKRFSAVYEEPLWGKPFLCEETFLLIFCFSNTLTATLSFHVIQRKEHA